MKIMLCLRGSPDSIHPQWRFLFEDSELEDMMMPDELYEDRNKLRSKVQSAIKEMGDLAAVLAETFDMGDI